MRPTPFRYAPCGDSDGESVGTDHFVLDAAGEELACPADPDVAKLFAAAPDMLTALKLVATWMRRSSVMNTVGAVGEILRHAENAIAKATE